MAFNDQSPIRGRGPISRRAAGYQPARKPKLRARMATEPPPLPPPPVPEVSDGFGGADEDGLRMLAALETMESLEPDFCGDLVTEASVTIIERADIAADPDEGPELVPEGSLRARLGEVGAAPDIDPDEHAAYQGYVEEATVEIVVLAPSPPVPHAALPLGLEAIAPLPGRIRRTQQFLQALIGSEDDENGPQSR